MESEVATAIRVNDRAVLRRYGRFLEPISQIVQAKLAASVDDRKLEAAVRNVAEPQARPAYVAPPAQRPSRIRFHEPNREIDSSSDCRAPFWRSCFRVRRVRTRNAR